MENTEKDLDTITESSVDTIKPVKQTLFNDTNITVYEVKRHHRSRGRNRNPKSHHHRVHPKRSLSQGATPRSRHPLSIRQPLAPQRRLSVSKLDLSGITGKAKYSGYQKSTLICLSIISFTSMLSMSLIAPFFPLEASKKGMRETTYGFVFSVYALVDMIFCPICGLLIPKIGPNFMLISGVFVCGASNILFGVLDRINDLTIFTVYCFVVRIFEAIGAAAFSTASYTIIMQVFPNNIGTAFGLIETFIGLGMAIGPAIGGGLYSLGGYSLPFFVLGGLMLVTIPLCLYIIKPIDYVMPIKKDSESDTYLRLLSIPQILVVGLIVMLVSQTISFLDPTIEPHFREMNISPEYVSIVFLLLSATYTVCSPLVGWFSGYFDNKFPIMALGMLVTGIGLLLIAPSFLLPIQPSLLLSVASMGLVGVAYAVAFIPTFESLLDLALDRGFSDNIATYSLVSGFWSAFYSLGEVTGPSLGGWLSEHFDFSIASTIVAAFMLIGAVMAGITSFFINWEESDSSSSSSSSSSSGYTEYEKSLANKSAKSSRRASQWEEDDESMEKEALLSNSITEEPNHYYLNNNGIDRNREKKILFSVQSI
ncbi:MFS-type transporter SLC18B1-like [Oppia nitens]|uniref:MFS-type transporter SLC18B1-like n=1 Tax=Oppia nitens TaxID=1686743 RepID=UPI0023DA22A2|nr:MFS-type transporter SLC18B1-like [Oppia nitens]